MGYTFKRFQKLAFLMFLTFSAVPTLFFIILIATGKVDIKIGLPIFLAFLSILFWTLISLPKIQCNVLAYKIDRDMPSMTRRFVINLQSGMSLFSSYADLAKTQEFSARMFNEVVSKIYLGMPIEKAIQESIDLSPSKAFKKVQAQVKSALMTGSNLETVMEVTLQEMIKDQIVKINLYGKKLGPLAMIYLIFGAVMPSIGSVVIVIIASIALGNIQERFFTVVFIALIVMILMIQFLFINMFAKMRPNLKI